MEKFETKDGINTKNSKSEQMKMKWDIPEKVDFIDPLLKCSLQLGASGEIEVMVSDSRKVLMKLADTKDDIPPDEASGLINSLQTPIIQLVIDAVKANMPTVINKNSIDLLEFDSHLNQISAGLRETISPYFNECGLEISQFSVEKITLPEEDPNFKRICEFHTILLQARIYSVEASLRTEPEDEELPD